MNNFRLSRRTFLAGTALVGAGLALRFNMDADAAEIFNPELQQDSFSTSDTWLHIAEDNTISIKIPSSEMGQGIHTGLAMIVAEELDADWQNIKIQQAPFATAFNNPRFNSQITGGSTSTPVFWKPLRNIGASARIMLIQAASEAWNIPVDKIKTDAGFLVADGQRGSYGSFALAAAKLSVPENIKLKASKDFRLIGKNTRRLDTPVKITGRAVFGLDVQRPDMLVAAVLHSPVFDGELKSFDETKALSIKGVVAVKPVKHGIAVLAKDYWTAQKGLQALQADFDPAGVPLTDSSTIITKIKSVLDEQGKANLDDNAIKLDLEYYVPFLAHATMEPMNCTVHVQQNRCDIWAPTQGQTHAAETAAKITGLDLKQIYVNTTYLGGGFGRRSESDFIDEAVTLSKDMNKPVKVIWSREQDMQHDYYRPAMVSRFQIQLDDQGSPVKWHNQLAGPSIFKRIFARNVPDWIPLTRIIGDPVAKEGAKQPPYAKGELEVDFEIVNLPVPVGFWRSVGASYNAFFVESVIDEAAAQMNTDTYQYRRKLLQNHPRLLSVLDLVANKAQWGKSKYKQGIAIQESFGSVVAQVVELTVDANKGITLHRIVCAADCGTLVNPDSVNAQMESGIIYGLTAALFGEITISKGQVDQSNFHDYPMLRMNQCPPIEVHFVNSNEAPGGAGEPSTPPIAPALTNALFAATGERLRSLPIVNAGYQIKMS